MDCEKFEKHLMDLLYDDLDELTKAAAIRHSDQCPRCKQLHTGLRQSRELSSLLLTEPPDGFESRVLSAERQVHRRLPLRQRVARVMTIASGYAMRPQLAMAALLLLMIGSSLALLRPKAGPHSAVTVTESGVPQKEEMLVVPQAPPSSFPAPTAAEPREEVQIARGPEAPPIVPRRAARFAPPPQALAQDDQESAEAELDLARSKAEDDAFSAAMSTYQAGQLLAAQRRFDEIVSARGKHAPRAQLLAAQATEKALGCTEALARFDSVAAKQPGALGQTAIWHSANCRKRLGQTKRAVVDFEKLVSVPAYSGRARRALSELQASGEGRALAESNQSRVSSGSRSSASAPNQSGASSSSNQTSSGAGNYTPRLASKRAATPAKKAPAKKAPMKKGEVSAGAPRPGTNAASKPAAPSTPKTKAPSKRSSAPSKSGTNN